MAFKKAANPAAQLSRVGKYLSLRGSMKLLTYMLCSSHRKCKLVS